MNFRFDGYCYSKIVDETMVNELVKLSDERDERFKCFEDQLKALNIGEPALYSNSSYIYLRGFKPDEHNQDNSQFKKEGDLRYPKVKSDIYLQNKDLLNTKIKDFDIEVRDQCSLPNVKSGHIFENRGMYWLKDGTYRIGDSWIYRFYRCDENIESVKSDNRFQILENWEMQKLYDEEISQAAAEKDQRESSKAGE